MSKVSGEGGEAAETPQPAKSTFVKASDQKVTVWPAQTSCVWRKLLVAGLYASLHAWAIK